MNAQTKNQATPLISLCIFMPSALIVIALVLINAFRPDLIDSSLSMVFNSVFWVALILASLSLVSIGWHFLRQMAADGFSFIERLSLGILIPSALIVIGMAILAAINPGGIMAGTAINQLFWGMLSIMTISLMFFIFARISKSSRRRKKKAKMYYY